MWAKFDEIKDLDLFKNIMDVNYLGSVYCTYYALPHLKKSNGRIVAISSLTGKVGVPTRTAYSASKHALHGFFDSLRAEEHDNNIKVLLVCPGFIQTNISINALTGTGETLGTMDKATASGLTPKECARQIRPQRLYSRLWLCSQVSDRENR